MRIIALNMLYVKLDNGKEIANVDITDGLTFLGLTESPSIANNYADTTMMDGELFNYARYASTTVKVKFLLKFNSRADFKLAKHDVYRAFAQKGIYRLRTAVEPELVRYCRVGEFEIESDPSDPNWVQFEVPFENPRGMLFSRLNSDQMTDKQFGMNLPEKGYSYHFTNQSDFTVYNPSDIPIDPYYQSHVLKLTMHHNGGSFTLTNQTNGTSFKYNSNLSGNDTLLLDGIHVYRNNNLDSANSSLSDVSIKPLSLATDENHFRVDGAGDLDVTFSFPFIYLS
ncbi:phage tail domain-containing protein [Limosilactobacillus fermentum]|uniref:phage tail domain-containing protein n=1 Tax=Limosilactobacillus fermentum TaxID=1613 RepID=UPI003FA54BDB